MRGQLALEFLIIYIFFITLFAATIFVIQGTSARQLFAAQGYLARAAVAALADEIAIAAEFWGYEKNLTLPQTIGGLRYTATIFNGTLVVRYEVAGVPASIAQPLPTTAIKVRKIPTTIFSEELDVQRGWVIIKNVNGTIEIT